MTSPAPIDESISITDLVSDPYPIYARLRAQSPVVNVPAVKRTFVVKAADTKAAKDDPVTFSSNDPSTPMERAFHAHTLMRKDGDEHLRERMAMAPAYAPKLIKGHWMPLYERIAEDYIGKLPRGEVVDLFPALAQPYASRVLAHLLGIDAANDAQMARWSQNLIDGAGNFGWFDEPFERVDRDHDEMNLLMDRAIERHRVEQGPSALSAMVNADDPIPLSQIRANIKIAIGGGINEPRDALCTILYGVLGNHEFRSAMREDPRWHLEAFEEGIRWVAPIQISSRVATRDAEIRDCVIPKGTVVATIQASAGHDEEIHEDGHRFDLFREKKTHQSFGNGPHFCQGTHVARMMLTRIVLPMLFERFPNMELIEPDTVVWSGFGFRGPLSLPVRLQ